VAIILHRNNLGKGIAMHLQSIRELLSRRSRVITQKTGTRRMKISLKHTFALCCIAAPLLAGCDAMAGKKDYAYFRQHIDEAKSVSDQCQLNGTSGMSKEQIAQCGAARDAYSNRNYSY
jgi:hypothetical protein